MAHDEKTWELFRNQLRIHGYVLKACAEADIPHTTYYSRKKRDDDFAKEVDEILEARAIAMEDSLYKTGLSGLFMAQKYWLENHSRRVGSDRWVSDRYTGNENATELLQDNIRSFIQEIIDSGGPDEVENNAESESDKALE